METCLHKSLKWEFHQVLLEGVPYERKIWSQEKDFLEAESENFWLFFHTFYLVWGIYETIAHL